jgi:mono/diheme cytochrome c family protein
MNNAGLVGFDLRKFQKKDHERFANSVRHGKPPNMPPWGDVLSSQEIEALWAYVQSGGAQQSGSAQ